MTTGGNHVDRRLGISRFTRIPPRVSFKVTTRHEHRSRIVIGELGRRLRTRSAHFLLYIYTNIGSMHKVDEFHNADTIKNTIRERCCRRKVAPGDDSCLVVTNSGSLVSTAGVHVNAPHVGVHTPRRRYSSELTDEIAGWRDTAFVSVSATDNSAFLVLSDTGSVYSGIRFSKKLELNPIRRVVGLDDHHIISIASGRHCLAVTSFGAVFSWGLNDKGQCGISERETIFIDKPWLISIPTGAGGQRVQCKSAVVGGIGNGLLDGGSHSLLLTTDGHIYAFGCNEHGQLGRGFCSVGVDEPSLCEPVRLSGIISSEHIVSFAAGTRHSLAVTDENKLFGWGSDYYNELGFNANTAYTVAPTRRSARGEWTLQTTAHIVTGTPVSTPANTFPTPTLRAEGVASVSAYQTLSAIVSDHGEVCIWGTKWTRDDDITSPPLPYMPTRIGYASPRTIIIDATISNVALTVETVELASVQAGPFAQLHCHRVESVHNWTHGLNGD